MKIECLCHRYSGKGYAKTANYISNPNVEFKGAKTGSDLANNARVLIETRFRSASVGDESAIISEYSIECIGQNILVTYYMDWICNHSLFFLPIF